MSRNIMLGGFGTFNDDPSDRTTLKDIKKLAKGKGLKFYPTYYDWTLEGDENKVEEVTVAMWNMSRDEWGENGLSII